MKLRLSFYTFLLSLCIAASPAIAESKSNASLPKVVFFDVNETLLDLGNVAESIALALGGRKDLVPLWFRTLLHYSLVSNVTNDYHHFGEIGIAALKMVAQQYAIPLTDEAAEKAVKTPFRDLAPHQDVVEGLNIIRALGVKMITLTNSSDAGIAAQLKNANLTPFFDGSLTVQQLQRFKPDLRVYQWATEQMHIQPHEAMLVAAHAWDIAGADKAGWQTAFIQRPGKALYPLASPPDVIGNTLIDIAMQLKAMKQQK